MKAFGMHISRFLVLSLIATICCVNCHDGDSDVDDTNAAKSVARSNTLFTSDLYGVLRKSNPNNLIFSSFSLRTVLAMIKAGARGTTANEIVKGMKFPTDDVLFKGYRSLLKDLKSNKDFTLEAANRVYCHTGFQLQENFTNILKNYFNSEVEQLDFSEGAIAAKEINGWVEKITRDKIKDLINPSDLSALTRLVLVNAIYFKGLWKHKFNLNSTVKAPFWTSQTKSTEVDMMKLETDLPYAEFPELKAKAVSLPYKGDRLTMIVVLPDDRTGLADLEAKLKTFNLAEISGKLAGTERKVSLSLPRFKLESTIDLKTPLTQLGMGSMFDSTAADFSGIPTTREELYVSKAVQKAFIEVNEEGSEAAAATGIIITTRSGRLPTKTQEFIADHPFIAFIYDHWTETTLFVSTSADTSTTAELRVAAQSDDQNNGFRQSAPLYILPIVIFVTVLTKWF